MLGYVPRVPPVALYGVGDEVEGGAFAASEVLGIEVLGSAGFAVIGFETMTGALPPGNTSPVVAGIDPVTPGNCDVDAVGTMLEDVRGESTFTGVCDLRSRLAIRALLLELADNGSMANSDSGGSRSTAPFPMRTMTLLILLRSPGGTSHGSSCPRSPAANAAIASGAIWTTMYMVPSDLSVPQPILHVSAPI